MAAASTARTVSQQLSQLAATLMPQLSSRSVSGSATPAIIQAMSSIGRRAPVAFEGGAGRGTWGVKVGQAGGRGGHFWLSSHFWLSLY